MFKILKKELLSFLKDKRAVMLTFLLPTILISVFALAFGGSGNDDIQKIPLLVCDQDNTSITRQTISDIDSVKMIEVIPCSYDSGMDLVTRGKKAAMLVFRKGFSDSVSAMTSFPCDLHYDASQTQEMGIIQSLLGRSMYSSMGKAMRNKSMKMNKDSIVLSIDKQYPGMDKATHEMVVKNINKNFESASSGMNTDAQSKMKLNTVSVVSAKVGNLGLVQAVAGTAVMMLLFSLTGMGGGLLDEKEQGTLKRLLYSPVHPAQILLGKMACSIIVATFQLAVMFIFASLVFHLQVLDKIVPLSIIILATAFACSGFGVFLATIARSRAQLQSMSTLIILSMSVIGGSMVPTFIMPQWMQNISVISINYWSIQGFYDILYRDLPIGGIFLERVCVLLIIGIVLTLLAFRFFRKNVLSLD
jgi:ABC-type multidrug transport system permease subunit